MLSYFFCKNFRDFPFEIFESFQDSSVADLSNSEFANSEFADFASFTDFTDSISGLFFFDRRSSR